MPILPQLTWLDSSDEIKCQQQCFEVVSLLNSNQKADPAVVRHCNMHKHLPEANFATTLPVAVCFVMILTSLCFYRQTAAPTRTGKI